MKLCVLIMAVLSYSLATAAEVESKGADPQVATLLQIAAGLGLPLLVARTWTGRNPRLEWRGVVCDQNQVVVSISLPQCNLSGTVSPALSNLKGLQRLTLSNNHLTGGIPSGLTTLPNLQVLDVRNNRLTGKVPEFRSSIRLFLDRNHFGG